jgi:hypothetical protein
MNKTRKHQTFVSKYNRQRLVDSLQKYIDKFLKSNIECRQELTQLGVQNADDLFHDRWALEDEVDFVPTNHPEGAKPMLMPDAGFDPEQRYRYEIAERAKFDAEFGKEAWFAERDESLFVCCAHNITP